MNSAKSFLKDETRKTLQKTRNSPSLFAFSEQISLFLLACALRRARVVARDIGGVSARRRDARVRETEMSAFAGNDTIYGLG